MAMDDYGYGSGDGGGLLSRLLSMGAGGPPQGQQQQGSFGWGEEPFKDKFRSFTEMLPYGLLAVASGLNGDSPAQALGPLMQAYQGMLASRHLRSGARGQGALTGPISGGAGSAVDAIDVSPQGASLPTPSEISGTGGVEWPLQMQEYERSSKDPMLPGKTGRMNMSPSPPSGGSGGGGMQELSKMDGGEEQQGLEQGAMKTTFPGVRGSSPPSVPSYGGAGAAVTPQPSGASAGCAPGGT